MKKIIFATFVFVCLILSCEKKVDITQSSFLDDKTIENFVANHQMILDDIKTSGAKAWVVADSNFSVKDFFEAFRKKMPPSKVGKIFERYGLNAKIGHLQITTMQYGIVACTIEEALAEIENTERTEKQKASDNQARAWLKEIKSNISPEDYELVKKYKAKLYEIFNKL